MNNVQLQGATMNVVNGFLFGTGLILSALVMKLLFHIGFCG